MPTTKVQQSVRRRNTCYRARQARYLLEGGVTGGTMPNLTKKQLSGFETQLRERQRVLTEEINTKRHDAAAASTEDVIGGVGDPGDESVARMQADLSIEEVGRDAEELNDIDAALGRIKDGSYGECVECGNEIDHRRLDAQPTAMRCIECQSQWEKTHAHRSTPTL